MSIGLELNANIIGSNFGCSSKMWGTGRDSKGTALHGLWGRESNSNPIPSVSTRQLETKKEDCLGMGGRGRDCALS